jgi:hypothetical protein
LQPQSFEKIPPNGLYVYAARLDASFRQNVVVPDRICQERESRQSRGLHTGKGFDRGNDLFILPKDRRIILVAALRIESKESRLSTSKPGSTLLKLRSVERNKPAPTNRTRQRLTCTAMSVLRTISRLVPPF